MAQDQNEAEEKLRQELQVFEQSQREQRSANADYKQDKKEAKRAALDAKRRSFILTHTSFNSWYEALFLIITPALAWLLFSGPNEINGVAIVAGLAAGFFYLVIICDSYGGIFARIFYARELKALSSSPYPVHGYWALLRTSPPGDESHVTARLRFSDPEKVKEDIASGIVRKFQSGFYGGKYELTFKDGEMILKSHALSTPKYGKDKPTLRSASAIHDWMRGVLSQVATPLHAAYPIAQLSFSRS